jgi:hypothetical protein
MKKKYSYRAIAVLLALSVFVIQGEAGILALDTRIATYSGNTHSSTYRNSRITYKLFPLISGRVVHGIINNRGWQGESENYRVGVQGLYNLYVPVFNMSIVPYLGMGNTQTGEKKQNLSLDTGFEAKYRLNHWLAPVAGADVIHYSDDYVVDYHAGFSFRVFRCLSLDCLYTTLQTNEDCRFGGGLQLNLVF